VAGMKPDQREDKSGMHSLLASVDRTRRNAAKELDPRNRALKGSETSAQPSVARRTLFRVTDFRTLPEI
jgi:hypothetical protein